MKLSILGAIFAIYLNSLYARYLVDLKLSGLGRVIYSFLNKRWYFDIVYNEFVGRKLLSFGYDVSFKTIDRGLIEILGPYGLERTIKTLTAKVREVQSGYIYHYAFIMLLGITLLITIVTLWDYLSNLADYRLCLLYLLSILYYGYAEDK